MMSAKITSEHLARKVIVYVRQSTTAQVRESLESQRRQYALVEHARSVGFSDVELIDQDLGHSGSSLDWRRRFTGGGSVEYRKRGRRALRAWIEPTFCWR